jgi:hypothetical protein
VNFDECCTTCAKITGMDRAEWSDFLSMTPEEQAATAQAYKGMVWQTDSNVLTALLAALIMAGNVAGAVSGIGSAYTVLKAL